MIHLKLLVRAEGYSGFYIQKELEMEGIYSELADPDQVLFILPLLKVEHDYPFAEIGKKIKKAFAGLDESMKVNSIIEPLQNSTRYFKIILFN